MSANFAFIMAQSLSAIMGAMGGFSAMSASRNEAAMMNRQADLALQEAQAEAEQKRRQVMLFRESQAQGYNSSGVTLEGSPLVVLSDTVAQGNQEIAAILKRGKAMSDLYKAKASQTRSSGTSNLVSSLLGGAAGLGTSFILAKKLGMFGNKNPTGKATPLPPTAAPDFNIGG